MTLTRSVRHPRAQQGLDAHTPTYGLVNGACGFGSVGNRSTWPFWNVAAIPRDSPIAQSGLAGRDGCGACLRVTCTQNVRAPNLYGAS